MFAIPGIVHLKRYDQSKTDCNLFFNLLNCSICQHWTPRMAQAALAVALASGMRERERDELGERETRNEKEN
jgi:hypothetical protein